MTPPDAEARRRALTEHDRDMLVEASAGTGKTSVIAGRAALMLASGRPPGSIAAITYTEPAAAELAARIRTFVAALAEGEVLRELAGALPDGVNEDQRTHAAAALADIDGLVATTIHGFCRRIVLEHAVEARIDPGAVVMDGDEAAAMFERVLSAWLGRRLSAGTGADDPVAVLALDDPEHAIDTLGGLARFRRANPGAKPQTGASGIAGDARAFADAVEGFASWGTGIPAEDSVLLLIEDLRALAVTCRERAKDAADFRALWALSRPPPSHLVDGDKARLVPCRIGRWMWKRTVGATEADRIAEEGKARYAACDAAYADVVAGIGSAVIAALSAELDGMLAEYARAKAEAAALDFDDLLQHADRLVRGHPEVRNAIAERYRSILVDEVQDTDPFQASMLLSISGLGDDATPGRRAGALFMVGDPKQAIYRFRGADPASYARLRAAIEAIDPSGIVHLAANFRSLPPILAHVDRCLAGPLEAAISGPYLPLLATRADACDGYPRVARLDVPGDRGDRVDAIRDAEARAVAALCADLIGSRIPADSNGAARILRPCDIALLSPSHNGLWRWEGALLDAAVPVSPLAGKSLLAKQEAFDFLALVRTLADSRDTLAFGALLRGPLVGLTDAELLAATASLPVAADGRAGTLAATTDPSAVAHPVLADLLATFRRLRGVAASATPEALLVEAVERLRVRAALSVRVADGGARAQANVDALVRRARPYAVRGLKAFAAMLQGKWSDVLRDAYRDWPEGRCDDGGDAVTLCTVHNAKGLEWPVVIVANSIAGSRQPDAFLHRRSDGTLHGATSRLTSRGNSDARAEEALAERHERVRLWYVACTRAKDLLVLPRLPRVRDGAWASLVDLRLGELPSPVIGPRSAAGNVSVPAANEQSAARFAREAGLVAASAPALSWLTPSSGDPDRRPPAPSAIPDPDSATLADVAGAGRPRGATLHKLIEEVLTGELAEVGSIVRERAAALLEQLPDGSGPDAPDPAECAATAMAALAMPVVAGFRDRLVPEWPIHAELPDGSLVAGRADAVALDQESRVEVVFDWKSDVAPDPATRSEHVAQVSVYMKATNSARGALVYLSRSEIVWVDFGEAYAPQ